MYFALYRVRGISTGRISFLEFVKFHLGEFPQAHGILEVLAGLGVLLEYLWRYLAGGYSRFYIGKRLLVAAYFLLRLFYLLAQAA